MLISLLMVVSTQPEDACPQNLWYVKIPLNAFGRAVDAYAKPNHLPAVSKCDQFDFSEP